MASIINLPILKLSLKSLSICLLMSCSGEYAGLQRGGSPASSEAAMSSQNNQEYFAAQVQPRLEFCRTCHVPDGVADVEGGRGLLLSHDPQEDYHYFQTSWEVLGRGVEDNPILLKASDSDAQAHSGGAPWPHGSHAYEDVRIMLECWQQSQDCPF